MSSEEQPKRSAEPVGRQLRRAREQLGLDVSAIADRQHLRTSVIQAIEDGDYSKVDTELFLKGYVRAYARQVDLNADAVIRDLDAELEPLREERERQYEADPLVDIQRRKWRKRRVARAVIVVLVLGAIGFGITTWLADGDRRLPGFSSSTLEESDDESVLSGAEGVGEEEPERPPENNDDLRAETPDPDIMPEPAETEARPAVESSSAIDSASSEPLQEPLSETRDDELPTPPEATESTGQGEAAAAPEEVQQAVPTESGEVSNPAPVREEPVNNNAALRMSFSGDCWVQITDANGNRLASALRSEGDVLEVEGTAPLDVVIGAMSAVASLEFRGEPVDLDSFRAVNNRAQFTLER